MSFNPYESPYSGDHQSQFDRDPEKHSGLGIASFVISLVVGIGVFAAIAAGTAMAMNARGRGVRVEPAVMLVGMAVLVGLAASFFGIGLGIAGCLQANRTKTFAILGVIFNGLIILGVGGLLCLGAAAG